MVGRVTTGGAVPRVRARTTDDLPIRPPRRQRYPVSLARSVREFGAARELLLTFVERDFRLRYRQAVLGAAWALLQPLLLMVVFTLVFGRIARVGSEGVPYPLFAYTGLVPWSFLAGAIGYGTTSIVANAAIIRKIHLPREMLPVSSVLSAGIDLAVAGVILVVMLVAYGYPPRLTWLAAPVLVLILSGFAMAVTLVVSLITVYFRDTRYAVPTLLQVVLYTTPVAYPLARALNAMPAGLRRTYPYLNPLAPLIDGFRRTLLHGRWPAWGPVGVASVVTVVALVASYWWYKRLDPRFADVI